MSIYKNEIKFLQTKNKQTKKTIAVNPKEYFKAFLNKQLNKKHKGVRKDTQDMTFEAYANRILSLRELKKKKGNHKK